MTRIFRLSLAATVTLAAACAEAGPTAPGARPVDSAVSAAHLGITPVRAAAGVRRSGALITSGISYHLDFGTFMLRS